MSRRRVRALLLVLSASVSIWNQSTRHAWAQG
jgi:hypothetical protein